MITLFDLDMYVRYIYIYILRWLLAIVIYREKEISNIVTYAYF